MNLLLPIRAIQFAILVGLALGYQTSNASEPTLATAEVTLQRVPVQQILDGVIDAVNRTTISAQTSGQVSAVMFDVNDLVPKGAIVLTLDDTDQKAALEGANAAYREAEARFSEARKEHSRTQKVYASEVVSKSQMDKAEASLGAARAKLSGAISAQTSAQEQLDHTIVKAPYSGIVTDRHVELGELVQPGTQLMTGISLEALRVDVAVPQKIIETIRERNQASVMIDSGGSQQLIQAERLTVFPYADPKTHSFLVRVYLPAGALNAYPGMFVKVVFDIGEKESLLVPESSVAYRSEVRALYVLEETGMLSMRHIRIGHQVNGDQVEILSGLQAGETIALDPNLATAVLKEQRTGKRKGNSDE